MTLQLERSVMVGYMTKWYQQSSGGSHGLVIGRVVLGHMT